MPSFQSPLKLDIFVGFPSYGGNGGVSSECPSVREWYTKLRAITIPKLREEGRIGAVHEITIADTPITCVRNNFVTLARSKGAHVLVTIDSDMNPGLHEGESWFKPFFETAFDAIYEHYQRGPLVIGAPYCGPPSDGGGENIYVFQFENQGWHGDYTRLELSQFTRCEAEKMAGLSEVAALPTGLIMYDMRIFDFCEPSSLTREQVLAELMAGRMTKTEALASLDDGWFFYEWENQFAAKKSSTEDVAATRNMALTGMAKLGYNPLRCAWDSWAGHWKPWCVGKPKRSTVEHIAAGFRRAIEQDNSMWEVERDFTGQLTGQERINFASPFPKDFPMELVEGTSGRNLMNLGTRRIFDAEIVTLVNETPDGHLKALRSLVVKHSIKLGRKIRIIEVGSWVGESAVALADKNHCELLLCFDPWHGSYSDLTSLFKTLIGGPEVLQKLFEWNIRHVHSQIGLAEVRAERKFSEVAAHQYEGDPADIIFIDADHTYEGCKSDILAWLPHLARDGIMIGHDYKTPQFPGVDQAVEEIFGNHAKEYGRVVEDNWDHGCFWLVHESELASQNNGRAEPKGEPVAAADR